MPVDSVWQPAKKRGAAAKKTGFARKIDIFQDRHLLSSATRAIAFLFASTCGVRNLRPDAGIGSLRCWSWRAGQDFGARSPALGHFRAALQSRSEPQSGLSRAQPTHHHLSRDPRDLSQARARSAFHRRNSSGAAAKSKNAAAGCINRAAKCSPDFLTRSEDRLFGLFSI